MVKIATRFIHVISLGGLVVVSTMVAPVNSGIGRPCLRWSQSTQKTKHAMRFETTLVGEMRDRDGIRLAFTVFRASDGTKLTLTHHRFDSPLEAQRYFDKCVENASKVASNTTTKDKSGATVRQRAEAILPTDKDSGNSNFAILWTNGSEFQEIISESREHSLLFEKQVSH